MTRRLLSFWNDRSGAAAAEMALVVPLLLVILFGAFELGKYFLDEHVVAKSVRDGARFAARQPFTDYAGCTVANTVRDNTRNITRTGQISGGAARLDYWTNPATISVTVTCDTSGTYEGIYNGSPIGAPVVTVSATVPYTPLFASIAFPSIGLNLNAASQATVTGL